MTIVYLNAQDRGSTNGTAVNGVKIAPKQWVPVAIGDTVLVGVTSFVVVCEGSGGGGGGKGNGNGNVKVAIGGKGNGKK